LRLRPEATGAFWERAEDCYAWRLWKDFVFWAGFLPLNRWRLGQAWVRIVSKCLETRKPRYQAHLRDRSTSATKQNTNKD